MKFVALALALLLPAFAYAQSIDSLMTGDQVPSLTLDVEPQNPEPGSTVTVTPDSTLLDLQNATVTIAANGTKVYSGDVQSVSVPLAANGAVTTITATAVSDGQSYNASATLDPGAVELVEEPLASAPVLYAGKPLVPEEGNVRLVAVADFRTSPTHPIPASALSYTWTQDGTTLNNDSGIGKEAVVVAAPLEYRDSQVSVVVQSQDGSVMGSDSVNLTPQPPTMRLYAVDPLQGVLYDHALGDTDTLTGAEMTFDAEPYSLSLANGLPAVNWFVNGASVQQGGPLTLRPTGSGSGSADISAAASSGGIDNATASLTLSFGSSSSGLFGL